MGVRMNDANRDLTGLHEQVVKNQDEMGRLAHQNDRQRVDIEAAKNRTQEIVPGISVRIVRTYVKDQSFDGWVWFSPDRQTIWVRGRGAQQPVTLL